MKAKKPRMQAGQSMVEYAAVMLLSTLMVAGIISGAHQVMPSIFDALVTSNEDTLSDGDPAVAATPSPTPTPTPTPTPSPSPSPTPTPTPTPTQTPTPTPTPTPSPSTGCHGNGSKSC